MYLKIEQNSNVTYSVDMLRLKTYISIHDFTSLKFRFDVAWNHYVKASYEKFSCTEFRYNYWIEVAESQSFWFGFMHNSEKLKLENDSYMFCIEFNPNKLKDNEVLKFILYSFSDWYIKSYDLACDIPISILDIAGFDKGRKKDTRIISEGYDNKTIYLGKKKSESSIKIYNKKIESNLNIMGELTRIEYHIQVNDYPVRRILYYNSDFIMPDFYTNDHYYTFKDYEDKTLLAILYAVQNGFPLNDLTKTYKKKVKELLEGGHRIPIYRKYMDNVLKHVIEYYFISSPKQHFFWNEPRSK